MWRWIGFDAGRHQALDADVNGSLRRLIEEGAVFDAIVLDPPKFAPTAAHAERAARAYKDINRLALKMLAPGGVLSPTPARAASAPTCSTKSWPVPGPTPGWTALSPSAWAAPRTTR